MVWGHVSPGMKTALAQSSEHTAVFLQDVDDDPGRAQPERQRPAFASAPSGALPL